MLQLLSNAFNDPSNPWYYVIGVLFLLLIFGALAVYVIWSGKKNKAKTDGETENKDETAQPSEQAEENNDTVAEPAAEPEKAQTENKDSE